MTSELHELFHQAESLPHGPARVAALEVVQQRADAEAADSDLPFRVRLALTWAYNQGGERVRLLVPFAWCVAEFDRDPARHAQFEYNLLWAFKWVPGALVDDPDIPLAHTLELLDDMERRYREGGRSLHAVHSVRHIVAAHIGDTAAAEEQFRAWVVAPRDDLSDCAGCDPSGKVAYLSSVGRHEEAVVTGGPVLQGALTCAEQPQVILGRLLESFARTGRIDEAADAHLRGYRLARTHRSLLDIIAQHVRFLAATGNDARALEVVERHLPWLDEVWSPWSEMRFAAAAARALTRVDVADPVRTPSGVVPAGELAAELAARARALAARFDARNGTDKQSTDVEALIAEDPWGEVPLSARARRVRDLQQRADAVAPVEPLPDVPQELPSDDLATDGLLDHFEARWKESDDPGALAALARLEETVPDDGVLTDLQRGRVQVARGLRAWRDDIAAALELFRSALPPLEVAGEEKRVRQVRARIGAILVMQGQYDEARAIAEEPLRWLVEHESEPRARSRWAGRLGELLLAYDPVEAEAFLRRARDEQDPRDAGASELWHGDALSSLERFDEAEEAYGAAVTASLRIDRRAAALPLLRRGVLRCRLGRPVEAVEDLAESAALLASDGANPAPVLVELAAAHLQAGQFDHAIQAGEEALPWVVDHGGDLHQHVHLRHLLAAASEQFGERAAEVEHLRAARSLLESWLPEDDDAAGYRMERLAGLADREARALSVLERDGEAETAFVAASEGWLACGYPEGAARALRGAARSAHWSGRAEDADAHRSRALALLEPLDSEEAAFHRAGISWDRSSAAADLGDKDAGIRHAVEAERLYRAMGLRDAADDAVLRQAHLGADVGVRAVEEIFDRAEKGSETWYEAGYLLADLHEAGGHARRAAKVRKRLEG